MLVHMAEDFIKGVSPELKIALENYKVKNKLYFSVLCPRQLHAR